MKLIVILKIDNWILKNLHIILSKIKH